MLFIALVLGVVCLSGFNHMDLMTNLYGSFPGSVFSRSMLNWYAYNLNDIRVSNAGSGSFVTINAALEFISEYVGSGLYTGEPIRIRVLPGTYPESVDLSPLAALGITDFTLEGAGDVTINGDGYDLYILTFEDSENSLFVNAGLVLSALQRIKAHYAEGGDLAGFGCTPIKLIGYSMGGVLARIALASAEDENGYAHGCNLLLTVDSPHRGFVVNSHLQDSLQDIVDLVEDFSAESTDIINELIEISDSPIARQLIRNNVNAESLPYDFIDGSNEYTNVFDFLNPCDAHNVDHLNQDVDYSSSANYDPQMDFKSGFPWKQNRIRKYAVAFGEHEAIGNTENHSSFANAQVKWKVLGIPSNHTLLNIEDEWFDKCPSSYFPTEFHFQQKIDPGTSGNATLDQVIEWIIDAFDMKVKLVSRQASIVG